MAVMKVLFLASLLMSAPALAQQNPSTEQVLGAIAGGALGSTIGSGDGKKAATVIGAIIGWRMGERVLGDEDHRDFLRLDARDLQGWCRTEVPQRYAYDQRLARAWVNGCVQRLQNQQRSLERQAYIDGLAPAP